MLKLLLADWLHADVAAIPIREDVFIKELNRPATQEWDQDDEQALHVVASLDGNAIGTARLTREGVIDHMAVLANFRRQGVGSAMLLKLMETARKSRLKQLSLNCPHTIETLFLKQGFTTEGKSSDQEGQAHITMVLDLNN